MILKKNLIKIHKIWKIKGALRWDRPSTCQPNYEESFSGDDGLKSNLICKKTISESSNRDNTSGSESVIACEAKEPFEKVDRALTVCKRLSWLSEILALGNSTGQRFWPTNLRSGDALLKRIQEASTEDHSPENLEHLVFAWKSYNFSKPPSSVRGELSEWCYWNRRVQSSKWVLLGKSILHSHHGCSSDPGQLKLFELSRYEHTTGRNCGNLQVGSACLQIFLPILQRQLKEKDLFEEPHRGVNRKPSSRSLIDFKPENMLFQRAHLNFRKSQKSDLVKWWKPMKANRKPHYSNSGQPILKFSNKKQ